MMPPWNKKRELIIKRNKTIPKNILSQTQKSQIPKEDTANPGTQEQKGLSFVGQC